MACPNGARGGWLVAAGLLLGLLFTASCTVARPLPGILKVGLVAPFSGRHYSTGYSLLFATRVALRQWNERGGVGGYRLELMAQDDGDSAAGGYLQAEKMSLDPDVIGVLGHPSDDSALVRSPQGSQFAGYRSPDHPDGPALVTFGPTREVGRIRSSWTLRLNAADNAIAQFVAQVVTETLKSHRVAIFNGSGEESARQAQAVTKALEVAAVEVVYQESLPHDTPDYSLLGQRVAGVAPDLVFFAGPFDQGASLLRQLRQAGVGATFLAGPGSANPEFAVIAAAEAKGAYYLSLAQHPRDLPEAQEFRTRYQELAGQEPDAMAALAYDAANILLTAADKALKGDARSNLREAIAAELAGLENFRGLTGAVTAHSGERVGAQVYLYRLDGSGFPGELISPNP